MPVNTAPAQATVTITYNISVDPDLQLRNDLVLYIQDISAAKDQGAGRRRTQEAMKLVGNSQPHETGSLSGSRIKTSGGNMTAS
ncbi:hypothetical protein W02_09580 [Nitrospira sp. KM1]|nr:hypothetical protein W02_09580 [Nitrospira sp. KM1]